MRASEWINLGFFSILSLIPWILFVPRQRRFRAGALGLVGIGLTTAGQLASRFIPATTTDVIRDWLPAGLVVIAYRQAGLSAAHTNMRLQDTLLRFDDVLLRPLKQLPRSAKYALSIYLEFAYLFCYPMIPLGLSILYWNGLRADADRFWVIVLPPTYICYGTLPLLQLLPPWLAKPDQRSAFRGNPFRAFNFWIVNHLSIRIDTFPSAHVAASLATALAVSSVTPRIGMAFFVLAASIAIGSFVQRYHYAIDVLLGGLVVVFTSLLNTKLTS